MKKNKKEMNSFGVLFPLHEEKLKRKCNGLFGPKICRSHNVLVTLQDTDFSPTTCMIEIMEVVNG